MLIGNRSRTSAVLLQLVATLLVLPFLLPLITMVQGSFAGQGWGNYLAVLQVPQFFLFFRNSVIIAAVSIVLVYACTMLAGYGFSKLRIRRKEVYFWLILACITLPDVVIMTPLFTTTLSLGIYNTYWAVILPLTALNIPFAVLLTRNFVNGIPDELIEAARIDGAGAWRVFYSVILPLTRPIAATVVVLTLIGAWNNYIFPLVLLQDPTTQTITQVPQFFIGEYGEDETKIIASAVLTAIPEIVAYLCLQRFFERGLAAGALK
jgi:multiple sugar transport system permease protein/raffinose/stachyose/melibiose transport system permease protein